MLYSEHLCLCRVCCGGQAEHPGRDTQWQLQHPSRGEDGPGDRTAVGSAELHQAAQISILWDHSLTQQGHLLPCYKVHLAVSPIYHHASGCTQLLLDCADGTERTRAH
jgi:hypothetical protein